MDWQPIETAPKDGTYVLIADEHHVTIGRYHRDVGRTLIGADQPYWEDYDHSFWDRYEKDGDDWFQPTKWAPLPSPPA